MMHFLFIFILWQNILTVIWDKNRQKMSSFILLLPLLLFYFVNTRTTTILVLKKINATHKCHPSCWCLISIQVLSNVCKCTNNEHIHKIQSQSLKLCFGPFMYIEKRLKIPLTENFLRFCDNLKKCIKRSFVVEIQRQFLYIIIISVFLSISFSNTRR